MPRFMFQIAHCYKLVPDMVIRNKLSIYASHSLSLLKETEILILYALLLIERFIVNPSLEL